MREREEETGPLFITLFICVFMNSGVFIRKTGALVIIEEIKF